MEAVMEGGGPMAGMEMIEVYFDPQKHTRDEVKEIVRRRLEEAEVETECRMSGPPKPGWEPMDYRAILASRYHRHLELFEHEVEGLDRQGFRELVRQKLQALGDEMLKAWEGENGLQGESGAGE